MAEPHCTNFNRMEMHIFVFSFHHIWGPKRDHQVISKNPSIFQGFLFNKGSTFLLILWSHSRLNKKNTRKQNKSKVLFRTIYGHYGLFSSWGTSIFWPINFLKKNRLQTTNNKSNSKHGSLNVMMVFSHIIFSQHYFGMRNYLLLFMWSGFFR